MSFCFCCCCALPTGLPGSLQARHCCIFFDQKVPNQELRKQTQGEALVGSWWPSKQELGWATCHPKPTLTLREIQICGFLLSTDQELVWVEALIYFLSSKTCSNTLKEIVTEEGM